MKTKNKKVISLVCVIILIITTLISDLGIIVSEVYASDAVVTYHGKATYGGSIVGNFTINGERAYCMEHAKTTPPSNTAITSSIYDEESIAKCLYYGYDGVEQWSGFSSSNMGIVITSLALDYFYNGKNHNIANNFIEYVNSKELPKKYLSFSNSNLVAYKDGNVQRTNEITLEGESQFSISFALQSGVTLHNTTKGTTSTGTVTVNGGDKFYLSTPLDSGITGNWTSENISNTCYKYSSIVWVSSNQSYQKLVQKGSFIVDPSRTINFSVQWLSLGGLTIEKKNVAGDMLKGVNFKIWNDNGYSKTLETDDNGKIILDNLTPTTYYVQEQASLTGYIVDNTVYSVQVKAGSQNVKTIINQEPTGIINVTKKNTRGDTLGAGFTFKITADEKITNKAGTVTYYNKGDEVARITTENNGIATKTGLPLGKYLITEVSVSAGYLLNTEPKSVTLSYQNQTTATVTATTTIINREPTGNISVTKKNTRGDTLGAGFTFKITADEKITNKAGTVTYYNKGDEVARITTGSNGIATKTGLPLGKYLITEVSVSAGYLLNTEPKSVTLSYQNQNTATVSVATTITNSEPTGNITVTKKNTRGDILGAGFTFKITADEKITNKAGTVTYYNKGDEVARITTGSNGIATKTGLPLGKYLITEVSVSAGYLLNTEQKSVTLSYQNQNTAIVYGTTTIINSEPTGTISITKKNEKGDILGTGFTFKITADEKITNKAGTVTYYNKGDEVARIITESNGIATKTGLPLGKYLVTEVSVSAGYLLNTEPKSVTLSYQNQNTATVFAATTITNSEPTGTINVTKKNENGDILGTGFTFKITAVEKITNKAGTVTYYNKGDEVARITTGSNGIATKTGLPLGKYLITEVSVSAGYLLNTEPKSVTLSYQNQNTATVFAATTITNSEPTGTINVTKKNENGDILGAGFTFKITADEKITNKAGTVTYYNKGDEVARITTGSNGIATKTGLPLGKYLINEVSVSAGYLLNAEVRSITLSYQNQNTAIIYGTTTIANSEPTGKITITKEDVITKNTVSVDGTYLHGDTSINGAVYTLYANDKITNVAKTITYFNAGDEIAIFTFNERGIATIKITNNITRAKLKVNGTTLEGLPMGKFILKETTVPKGYTKDNTVYEYIFSYKDMHTNVIEKTGIVYNTINKEPFEIIKISSNSNNTAELVKDVEFTVILKRYIDFYGSFDEAMKHTSEYKDDEWCVMKTDSAGYAKSKRLAYGTYVVKETYIPNDYMNKVEDFEITLRNDSETPTQHWKVENNTPFSSYIKIKKIDSKTGKAVTFSNATFELYKYNDKEDTWKQVQCKVGKDYFTKWTTDKDGIAYTETKLDYGVYKLIEAEIPQGFNALENEIMFRISGSNATCEYDKDYDAWITVIAENEQPTGTLKLNKKVNLRQDVNKTMIKDIDFTKISFELVADENIIDYADGSVIYEKGTVIGKYNLNSNASLTIENIRMGKYYLKELTTIEGAILDETEYKVIFEQTDTKTKEYIVQLNIENKTTCTEISKADITGEKELVGAKLIVTDENNEVIDSWVSSKETHKIEGLKVGQTYTLTEEIAPDNYVKATSIKFTVKSTAEIQKVTMIDKQVTMIKEDIAGKEVEGAELKVVDKDGNIVDSWTSTKEPHKIKGLIEGESYTLYEEYAPDGFVIANEIEFTVTEDKATQEIQMIDKVVEISKVDIVGEEIEGATLIVTNKRTKDIVDKWVSTKEAHKVKGLIEGETYILHEEIVVEGYVKATDIEFIVTEDKETQKIEMVDKIVEVVKIDSTTGEELEGAELKVVDKDGNIVDSWTSTKEPHRISGLVEGESYTLYEEYAPDGFVISNKIDFTVTEDKATQEIQMIDKVVEISKVDIAGEEIEGATLIVINKKTKDIVDKWVSTKEAHKVKGLIEGETYILHEEIVVEGYVKATDIEFIVTDDKETQKIEMVDKIVEVVKTDFATGEELEGAKLKVVNEDGEIVDEWVSTKEPHRVIGLEENKTYKLIEEIAPYGYEVTEEILFTVTSDKEIQKIEMKDMLILKNIKLVKVDKETREIIKEKFIFAMYEDSECTRLIKKLKSNKEEGAITFEDLCYGIYFIKELKSPDNYELSDKVVRVEINDKGVFIDDVEIQEENSIYSFEFENQKIEIPKTGDNRKIIFAIVISIISILGFAILVIIELKRKNK